MRLIVPVVGNVALVLLVYFVNGRTPFQKLRPWVKQVVIGVLFGGMSAFASEYGVPVSGVIMNVRDAAPISAGLLFGGPAGLIAGGIGGLYRWFSVYWGAGTYTRLACTISTMLAGGIAAFLRRFMFDGKRPSWGYGVAITVLCEVLHMMMIFLTNMDDPVDAFGFVRACTIPMVAGNVLSVGAAMLLVTLLEHRAPKKGNIALIFQRWLLVCIAAAFALTGALAYTIQSNISSIETRGTILRALDDVYQDVEEASDNNLLSLTRAIRDAYEGGQTDLSALAAEYDVSEINVVDKAGIISDSTTAEFVGFDMASGAQAEAFLVLLHGQEECVQKYGPASYDASILRKYAGVRLAEGFLQVGYDAERFRKDINGFVLDLTRNRHLGARGFIAVCDDRLQPIGGNTDITEFEIGDTQPTERAICSATLYGEAWLFSYTFNEGYYIIGAMPRDEALVMRDASLYTNAFMQILVFAALFGFLYFLIKKVIIDNLRKVNDTLARITGGDLNVTVDVRSNEEFASLSDDINSTVEALKRYIAEAAARIDRELEYAKAIQLSALPAVFPPYPKEKRFDIYATMNAAKEVGGDFYDFFLLDRDTVAFLCADVSGKGIPAAMFMMTAKTTIKDLAERGLPANEIFTQANAKLCENNESGMFVTAWMGILHLDTGELTYANAGHTSPLLSREGKFEYLRSKPGFVLAGMDGIKYRLNRLTLAPGDRIFLYTDGVTEATDSENRLYGEARLLASVNAHSVLPATELLGRLQEDIDAFVGDAPQFDDITMLALDFYGKRVIEESREITVRAEVGNIPLVTELAEGVMQAADCPVKVQAQISVAIDELFGNIARYAYGGDGGTVTVRIERFGRPRELAITFTDDGMPYNPLLREDPDVSLSAEERKVGGLGIYIVKKSMDGMHYEYRDGKNILTIRKRF